MCYEGGFIRRRAKGERVSLGSYAHSARTSPFMAVETESHLIQCLLYMDLNMVRAGVVRHPSEWPFSGYNEIQRPRERYALIDYQGLRALLDFNEMADLADAYRGWVEEALSADGHLRDGKWSESIAACPVKSGHFI